MSKFSSYKKDNSIRKQSFGSKIHAQESKESACEKVRQVAEKLKEMKFNSAAKKLQDVVEETIKQDFYTRMKYYNLLTKNLTPSTISVR